MLASHKFTIKKHIEQSSFDISLFRFETDDKFKIILNNTDLRFEVEQRHNNFNLFNIWHTQFKPDYPLVGPLGQNNNLENLIKQIDYWLKTVVKPYINEIELTQKWRKFESNIFDNSSDWTENYEPLDYNDIHFLKQAVEKIKADIRTEFSPSIELSNAIDKKLDYIIESTNRTNKFDIKGIILNTILSIGINLGVDTESGKQLVDIFRNAFAEIPTLFEIAKLLLTENFGK